MASWFPSLLSCNPAFMSLGTRLQLYLPCSPPPGGREKGYGISPVCNYFSKTYFGQVEFEVSVCRPLRETGVHSGFNLCSAGTHCTTVKCTWTGDTNTTGYVITEDCAKGLGIARVEQWFLHRNGMGWYFQRLREEIFGLVSEGRGIRQTGVKIPGMVTRKYTGGHGAMWYEKVVKTSSEGLNALLMGLDLISYYKGPVPWAWGPSLSRWRCGQSLLLEKTILAYLKWRKASEDQGHVHSTEVFQLYPVKTQCRSKICQD